MVRPKTLQAFTADEYQKLHKLLATRVALMMGRKFEEGDWAEVYCEAKDIPLQGWSNLNIDIMFQGLGIEHKMLKIKNDISLESLCGTTKMHPSLTRSIRVPSPETDANEAMQDVLNQYAKLVEQRRNKLSQLYPKYEPEMRTGWLLWKENLEEFLYFEEEMLTPNPDDYWAQWHGSSPGKGARKPSRNLWIFEKGTGIKRYSVTTEAGAKIQPYFDIPSPNDLNLNFFIVQGEIVEGDLVRLWVTASTYRELKFIITNTETDNLSKLIIDASNEDKLTKNEVIEIAELAVEILITREAYVALKRGFVGVSDEHLIQQLVAYLRSK